VTLDAAACHLLGQQCEVMLREVTNLYTIYDEHAGLQDRFIGAGRVQPADARRLGLWGLAGRASGQAADLRSDQAWPPYDSLAVKKVVLQNGDVAARVKIRFEEILESLRLVGQLCTQIAALPPSGALPLSLNQHGAGFGRVEGWRGEVCVALELEDGRIRRCHCHDPSWQNWPVLEHAIMGNIVPDFPLINKSFNLSYAGHDS